MELWGLDFFVGEGELEVMFGHMPVALGPEALKFGIELLL
jgi:hypothetical protein